MRFSWQQTHLQFGQKLIVGFRQNRWMAGIMGGRWQHIHSEIFTVVDGWFKTQSVDSRAGWKLEQQLHLAIWKNKFYNLKKKVCNLAKYIMIKFLAVVDGCGRQGWSNRARESWN